MCVIMCSFADGWTTADLVFLWKEGDPVQVVKNLHLPRFTLEKFLTDYCNSKTNTGKLFGWSGCKTRKKNWILIMSIHFAGEYSCLKVDLLFKREFSYYLIQIYIPCCMLVIVSWVSFWLDQGAVPARVSLGIYSCDWQHFRKRNVLMIWRANAKSNSSILMCSALHLLHTYTLIGVDCIERHEI